MMKLFCATVLAACLFCASAAGAVPVTGNSYLEMCSSLTTACRMYTIGVIDGLSGHRYLDPASAQVCLPEAVTVRQLVDVGVTAIKSVPEYRHRDALQLLSAAYHFAFPCEGFK